MNLSPPSPFSLNSQLSMRFNVKSVLVAVKTDGVFDEQWSERTGTASFDPTWRRPRFLETTPASLQLIEYAMTVS